MLWKPVFACSTLVAIFVLMTTATDYQRLAQKRHQERLIIRHLVDEMLPGLTSRLQSHSPALAIEILPFAGDEEGLVVAELARALKHGGRSVAAPHPLTRLLGVGFGGWGDDRRNHQTDLHLFGAVTTAPVAGRSEPVLSVTFQVARPGETRPLAEFPLSSSAEPDRLARVLEDDRIAIIPAEVPFWGGQRVQIDASLFLGVLLLATVVGMIMELSGWTWLQALKAAAYIALGGGFYTGWLTADSQAGLLLWAVIYSSALFHCKDEGKCRNEREPRQPRQAP